MKRIKVPPPEVRKKHDTNYLKTTFRVYDNIELKGEPSYIISSDMISYGKDNYKISESFVGACDQICSKYKFIPIDFVRIYLRSLALAIKEYKNGIARVEHKSKSYFFKFSPEDTNNIYLWRTVKNADNIKKILEQDQEFLAFVKEIKKCIKNKDLKCLKPYLENFVTIESISLEAKKRSVYDNENLCKEFKKIIDTSSETIGFDDVPEFLIEKNKNINFIWEKIGSSLDFSNKSFTRTLTIREFSQNLVYYNDRELDPPSPCFEQSKDIHLIYSKTNHKWKIVSFGLLGFNY